MQTVETFIQVIREISTCWLLLRNLVTTLNRLFFYDILIILLGKNRS